LESRKNKRSLAPPSKDNSPAGAVSHLRMDKTLLADIVQWDVRIWSQALDLWDRGVDWEQVHTCLDLGAGSGGLSLWMALKKKHVLCADIDEVNREKARRHHQKHHLDGYIEYPRIDATDIPFENEIDIVTIKSVLVNVGGGGNSERQQTAVDQIHKALRPGGKLLFAENLVGSPLHRFARRRLVKWGAWARYVTVDEMRRFLRRFSRVEMHTTGVLGAFGRTERQRNMLGAIDRAVLDRVAPRGWRYLVYGIAEK
jgi:ubiquinone/menaquinone biosynthesis C-methylase UbiE